MKPLPDKLSELIRIALHDEAKAVASKDYEIDMTTWHRPGDVCSVCLAGAVMAFTLDALPTRNVDPGHFDPETQNKLRSLEHIRRGAMVEGIARFVDRHNKWYEPPNRKKGRIIWDFAREGMGRCPSYYRDRPAWRKWLFKAAKRLKDLDY